MGMRVEGVVVFTLPRSLWGVVVCLVMLRGDLGRAGMTTTSADGRTHRFQYQRRGLSGPC